MIYCIQVWWIRGTSYRRCDLIRKYQYEVVVVDRHKRGREWASPGSQLVGSVEREPRSEKSFVSWNIAIRAVLTDVLGHSYRPPLGESSAWTDHSSLNATLSTSGHGTAFCTLHVSPNTILKLYRLLPSSTVYPPSLSRKVLTLPGLFTMKRRKKISECSVTENSRTKGSLVFILDSEYPETPNLQGGICHYYLKLSNILENISFIN